MSALLDDVFFFTKVEDKHFSILDNTCQQWSWYLPVPSLVNKSWHGHGFSRHRHRRNDEHPKKAIAQVYPSTGWWFGWKSHTNLSQHGSIWGWGDRVEIRALIFFLGVYIKHSCFIVPNYNSKFSRRWGDFSRSSTTLQCCFLNVIGDIDLCWWIRKNQGGAATSFQSSDLATGRHSAAESLWKDFSGRLHWRSHFPWQRFVNVQPRTWEATTLSPWPLATLQALSKLS